MNTELSKDYLKKYWSDSNSRDQNITDHKTEREKIETFGKICCHELTICMALKSGDTKTANDFHKLLCDIAKAEELEIPLLWSYNTSDSGAGNFDPKISHKEIQLNLSINDLGLCELDNFVDQEIQKFHNSIRLAADNGLTNVAERFETATFPLVVVKQKVQYLISKHKDFVEQVKKNTEEKDK